VFRTITRGYSRLLSWLLVASVVVLIIPVSLQIFSRYTALIPSYIWTEELARFCFIWSIMLGAMVGIREGTHFVVDLWPAMNARAQAALRLVASVFVLVFALVFLWWGIDFTRFAFNRISELAELPLWYIHVAWPLAGATWILFVGEQVWDDLQVLTGRSPPDKGVANEVSGGSATGVASGASGGST
jgi:TRAP-type C4-dicarboxylate transport system permease small subunit